MPILFRLCCQEHPQVSAQDACRRQSLCMGIEVALPYCNDVPSGLLELLRDALVAFYISSEFLDPEPSIRLWGRCDLASRMAMPEAAVDEYDAAVLGQHQVRFARQARLMHAKSKAKAMECLAKGDLGLCVP